MADSFKCRLCGEVQRSGTFHRPSKFVCPKHKEICEDHVNEGRGLTKCKVCEKNVTRYEFNSSRGRWEKA